MRISIRIFSTVAVGLLIASCSGGDPAPVHPDFSGYPDTPFTIKSEADLIGGPNAQGRIGDVLLKNDRVRVIIQKPRKNSGLNSFGGNIIDADIKRPEGEAGQDNFGSIFPLVNIEWTIAYRNYEVIEGFAGGSAKTLRAYGTIDAYDYLDLDFIGDVAEGVAGQPFSYSNRFDDRRNPFEIYEDLRGLSTDVVTDYILEDGKNYVRIETTFTNSGEKEVKFPVGQFINGSGEVSMLIPGIGFTPDLMTQVEGGTPALIYAGFDGVGVSYGFFYDPREFIDPETSRPYKTTSVSYSDLTGILFGEEFLKIAPLGKGGTPEIHFKIPPNSSRKVTGYFVVGDGSAGSVMTAGLAALKASARQVTGTVLTLGGRPMAGATVALLSDNATVVTYRTDAQGHFKGMAPSGGDPVSRNLGSGKYRAVVDLQGFQKNGTLFAGACSPEEIDIAAHSSAHVICLLGESGRVVISKPILDEETGRAVPARLTIVGLDPSPNKSGNAGLFYSTNHREPLFGIADVKYITAKGTIDLTGKNSFDIEPGTYLFVVSRGPEYTSFEKLAEVTAGGEVDLGGIVLKRAVRTPGYISADFHVHSISSPDSAMNHELRALTASAEGLDVLQSSDHDFLFDYAPVVAKLEAQGLIPRGEIKTAVGDEVTPNHYGHLHAFPLTPDPDDPEGGAPDWSLSPLDEVSPAPDYVPSQDELIEKLRDDPGEEVIQINHIMDVPTGIPVACGWVTSPMYEKDFGVKPLSSYADPVERRMAPSASGGAFPIPFGASGLATTDINAVELTIGPHLHDNGSFFRSALPTWFNLLNLGVLVTATADSDTHQGGANPIGLPRNFIASKIDPRDGMDSDHSQIDLEEYARAIVAHKVTVSAGPVVTMRAKSETGGYAEIGGTIKGRKIKFDVEVSAPSWGWFDTIEVFANTEPIPVDDETDMPMQGTASDPAEFYKPYHVPRYTYEAAKSFSLSDGTLEDWNEEEGVITAKVSFELNVTEDTWVVAMARGTRRTEGYRSLFPIETRALVKPSEEPEVFDPANLNAFHADEKVGASAWGLTNPIFIVADGNGFEAKYVREGLSPVGN